MKCELASENTLWIREVHMMVVINLMKARLKNFPYLESHIYTSQEIRLDLQITRNLEIHPHRLYMLFNLIGACEDKFLYILLLLLLFTLLISRLHIGISNS